MSRKPADPVARLARLSAARGQAVDGDIANADDMSRITGMTWRNLKLTIDSDPAFPVISRGAEGIAWQFSVCAVLDHMIARCRAVIAENDEKAARMARMAGVPIPASASGSGLSMQDLATINRLQIETQRRKIEQGEWVRKEDVRNLMSAFFSMVQEEHLATASERDPAGRWPADVRAGVSDHMRGILVRLHDRFGAWIANEPRPARRTGRRAGSAGGRKALRNRT